MSSKRGGRREGAGRPRNVIERKRHSVNATQEEWAAIEAFVSLVRTDKKKCDEVLRNLCVDYSLSREIRR